MRKLLSTLSSTLYVGVRWALLFLALFASVDTIYASYTEVDGIWYNFNSSTKTASVTYKGWDHDSYYNEYSGSVTIPETVTYNGTTYSVTSIGDYAFRTCKGLTSVTIPNSVTSIGDYAFSYCSSLTSVTIPNSVTSIGDRTFYECSKLTSVTIPNSLKSIGFSAFGGCSGLTKTNYTGDVASWCAIDFDTNDSNPISYSRNIYINNQEIKDLVIPNSVTSIGFYAFFACSTLTSVTIPNSVTSIGISAFCNCSGLTSLTIGNSVTSIEHSAFLSCSKLTSVTIPNSVTSIGKRAFENCYSLTSVTIPNSVICIGDYAFENCSSLTSVTIPNSVTSIGDYAFCNCSGLTSLTIGNSVISIGERAFNECKSLKSITCEAVEPPTIGNYTFDAVSPSIPVYVPCGTVEAYKAAYLWSDFSNIQEPLPIYSINVAVNDNSMGVAQVDYNTACGCQISARSDAGCRFVEWSDGNTDNPRSLELTQNTSLVANFEIIILTPDTATICYGDTYQWHDQIYNATGTYYDTLSTGLATLHLTIFPAATIETQTLVLCPSELPYEWYGQMLTEAGSYTATEQYAGMECDSVIHELTLNVYMQTLPAAVTLPIVRIGEAIDVSVPTAEIQAHIAADTWYAPNALVSWYIMENSDWTSLTDEPVAADINEVVMKYAVESDCGNVESDKMIFPVESTGVENIPTDEVGVYKVIRDNKIFIIRGGGTYSILGHAIEE